MAKCPEEQFTILREELRLVKLPMSLYIMSDNLGVGNKQYCRRPCMFCPPHPYDCVTILGNGDVVKEFIDRQDEINYVNITLKSGVYHNAVFNLCEPHYINMIERYYTQMDCESDYGCVVVDNKHYSALVRKCKIPTKSARK